MFYESLDEGGSGGAAAAAATAIDSVEETVDFLKGLTFEIDTTKNPVSYLFDADESDMQLRQLVTVNATSVDGKPYWSQVFYKSSGSSSKTQETWFPLVAVTYRAFIKGISLTADWFRPYDAMWNPRFPSSGDLPKRFFMFSFLLASNQLQEIKDDTLHKLEKQLQPAKRNILRFLKDTVADSSMQSKLKTFIPKEPTLLKESSDGSYDKINLWIGGDNYTGIPASNIAAKEEKGMLGGKRRSVSLKKKRKHGIRRKTRRQTSK